MEGMLAFRVLLSSFLIVPVALFYYLHCKKNSRPLSPLATGLGYFIGQVIVTLSVITVDHTFNFGWVNNIQQYASTVLAWATIKSALIYWGNFSYNIRKHKS